MDYGELLTRAWRVAWHNKYLFLLGILASLGSAGSYRTGNFTYSFDEIPTDIGIQAQEFMLLFWPAITALICIGLFIAFALWLLRLTSQAGLISAAARIDQGEKVSFGDALSSGLSKLGRMIGINVLLYGPFLLVGLIIAAVASGIVISAAAGAVLDDFEQLLPIITSLGALMACVLLLFCALLPILLLISVIYPFAQRAAVLDDYGVADSIRQGWRTVRENLGDVLILVILFLLLGALYGMVIFAVMLPMAAVALVPVFLSAVNGGSLGVGDFFLLACGGLISAIVIALLNSVLVTYRSVTVTLAYREFQRKVAKTISA